MELKTKVEITAISDRIRFKNKVLFLGSCFADEIGAKMKELRFQVSVNPFGVLFNPSSIVSALNKIMSESYFTEEILVKNKEVYLSRMHSSIFASLNKHELIETINYSLRETKSFFNDTDYIVVSLGTSWVYRLIQGDFIVANCHKTPASDYSREFLQPEETFKMFSEVISKNLDKKWIFTVSPVRHFKDGAHGNQLSKSSLHLAVNLLQNAFPNVFYFPAYEILNDELRDYRFYDTDMLHPSDIAVNYIWESFAEYFLDKSESYLLSKIEKYNKMLLHRALFQESNEFKLFVEKRDRLGQEIIEEIDFILKKKA